ncbi:type IV secretion system DNA-binding domain-containing protein [Patescibacteria group bacterium]|nr:type IV secretion system DNA-binding domain-containing protein [Patescibacteria group bacterium]
MAELTTLLLKLPRGTEVTPEAAKTFLAALTKMGTVSSFQKLLGSRSQTIALEIAMVDQQIGFQITCNTTLVPFVETQIQSNYPLSIIEKVADPLEGKQLDLVRLYLKEGSFYPIATYDTFTDIDPLSSVLSVLAKSEPDEVTIVQYVLESAGSKWQSNGARYAGRGTKNEDGTYSPRSDESIIKEKISYPGFKTSIRIASNKVKALKEVTDAYGVFTKADGNSFYASKPGRLKMKKETENLHLRLVSDNQILNIAELATLWHLPSEKVKTPSIIWGTAVLSEPPDNLPVATDLSDEEKANINFYAKTLFKNRETIFGIKRDDRRRHIWTVGKTGTGKTTMIANMAIDDLKKGRGLAIIDPHGDLSEIVLNYIPKNRINDTIYFNPADREYPIVVNPLEVKNREEAELVVSGLVSIFTKIWEGVWSARMEYIIRNSFLTLAQIPNYTLADVLKILVNKPFRDKIVAKLDDENLVHFWKEEFDKMPERLQKEAISPIQNKVGQFVTSPLIRRIIGAPKSSIQIDEIMNEGKILIANLSQGRLGEDNSALLGAMLITKIQLAAMHRIDIPEENRRDFYLYVDEFQNFATSSFIKIMSEARKFRLSLTLANQYMAQIPEEVQKAILGNAGTLISFTVGADDAAIIHKEYAEVFSENDLVNLKNFQIAVKPMIDGHSTRPFLAQTLPLPVSRNQNKQKVIAVSRERYARKYIEKKVVHPHPVARPETQAGSVPGATQHKPQKPTRTRPEESRQHTQTSKQASYREPGTGRLPKQPTQRQTHQGSPPHHRHKPKRTSQPPSGTVFENKRDKKPTQSTP